MKRTYTGPAPAVELAQDDGTYLVVARGETVDLPAQVAESLDLSGDWSSKSKTTAATRGEE